MVDLKYIYKDIIENVRNLSEEDLIREILEARRICGEMHICLPAPYIPASNVFSTNLTSDNYDFSNFRGADAA